MKCFTEDELAALLKRAWWNGLETAVEMHKPTISEKEIVVQRNEFINKIISEV